MKIVIDIDEKKYEEIKRIAKAQFELTDKTEAQIIANGMPYEEQQQGDLISREALKEDIDFQYICKCCHNVNGNVCDICSITEIEKKIDNAPTVDKGYDFGYADGHGEGYELGKNSRPQGAEVD